MSRAGVLTVFAFLGAFFLSGCVRQLPLKGRPSDSTEDLPKWALDPSGFKVAVQGVANALSVSVSSIAGTPQVRCEGSCSTSTRVASFVVPRGELIQALSTRGVVSHFTAINNFAVSEDGYLPAFTFGYGNDCKPIVFVLTDQVSLSSFTLTNQEIENRSRLIFFPGDANLDGRVDVADQQIFQNPVVKDHYGWQDGDFNGDDHVGSDDALCLIENFGTVLY